MNKTKTTIAGLLAAVVLFGAINVLSGALFKSARLDVTEEKLFTLSDGSIRIAQSLAEPVRLYFYYSEGQTEAPELGLYAKRVRELLEEFELRSGGSVELETVNPEPFSDEEDEAVQAGLFGARPDITSDPIYCGLIGRDSLDGEEVIAFFDPRKERFLEYDITRLVYTLANPDKETVGVLSSLPLQGAPSMNPMDPRGGTPPWQILSQLRNFFEVEMLTPDLAAVPESVDVLFLAHPKGLGDTALYAIDQFVLRGGRVMALVDPHCEADRPPTDPNNPMAAMQADRSSNLDKLFRSWGVEIAPSKVVGDRKNAMQVGMGPSRRPVSFVMYMALGQDEFDTEDPVISELGSINVAFPGALSPTPDASTTFTPLLSTSAECQLIEQSRVQFMPNPEDLLAMFVPEGEPAVLAARVSGTVSSAFPDGPPAAAPDASSEEGEEDAAEPEHLEASIEPVNLVVVSDADLLEDRFWITEQRIGPISLGATKTADNGDFVINVISNLCGSNDLISVRAGSRFARPLDYIDAIRREAEEKYLAESQALQQKLDDTEAKISELQREKSGDDAFILSAEQLAEIERFREQQVETRKQLRDVQHNLQKDIDLVETAFIVGNTGGSPLIFLGAALVVWLIRRNNTNRKTPTTP